MLTICANKVNFLFRCLFFLILIICFFEIKILLKLLNKTALTMHSILTIFNTYIKNCA